MSMTPGTLVTGSTVREMKDGLRWFFCAIIVAALFTFWLMSIDDKLTYSDREQRLGKELLRLRTAQTTLGGNATDSRQFSPELEAPKAAAEHGQH